MLILAKKNLKKGYILKRITVFSIRRKIERSRVNRELEFLPSDDDLADRMAKGMGVTRPELAILTAYGKMVLKERLVLPEIFENVRIVLQSSCLV